MTGGIAVKFSAVVWTTKKKKAAFPEIEVTPGREKTVGLLPIMWLISSTYTKSIKAGSQSQ